MNKDIQKRLAETLQGAFPGIPIYTGETMDNEQERNEHFKGFAELLWQELMDVHDGWIDVSDAGMDGEDINHYQQIIAQRAYDLVKHTLLNVDHIDLDRLETDEHVARIPDMTEWPKTALE